MIPSIISSRFVGCVRSEVRSDCVAVVSVVSLVVGVSLGFSLMVRVRVAEWVFPPPVASTVMR